MGYHFGPSNNASIDIYSLQEQFMFGDALLVTPIVRHNEQRKQIYLPNDTFFNLKDGKNMNFKDAEMFIDGYIDSGTLYLLFHLINHTLILFLKFSSYFHQRRLYCSLVAKFKK